MTVWRFRVRVSAIGGGGIFLLLVFLFLFVAGFVLVWSLKKNRHFCCVCLLFPYALTLAVLHVYVRIGVFTKHGSLYA